MSVRKPRLECDAELDCLRLPSARMVRGVLVDRRGGAAKAIRKLSRVKAELLAHVLHVAPAGRAIMVHTDGCTKRDDKCSCGGARLVPGALA